MAAPQVDPRMVEAGMAAMRAGDLLAAERLFGQMVASDARVHQAWNILAIIAVRNAMPELALERAQRAHELDRRNPGYLNTLAVAYGELGRHEEAKAALARALKLRPAFAEGHYNLGKVHYKLEDMDAALASYRRAFAIDPDYPGLRHNLAQVLREKGDLGGAAELLREAARRDPADGDVAALLGEVLFEGEGIDAAWAWCAGRIQADPGLHPLRVQAALMLLSAGRWEEGWGEYLWRMVLPEAERGGKGIARFRAARPGERILVRQEQGLGDVLFFARFLPGLKQRGLDVTLESPGKVAALLEGVPGADRIVLQGSAQADPAGYDMALWLGDLPAALGDAGTPAPAPVNHAVAADPARLAAMRARLAAAGPGPYAGLTWRAGTDTNTGPEFGASRQRQLFKLMRLPQFARTVRGWTGTLVALQRAPRDGELARLSQECGATVHDFSDCNEDLPAMAALLGCLDRYVTVSNTNVHLLAGLPDAPCRAHVLVPSPPEFRWMRAGEGTPWFPGMAVYRQTLRRDWEPAINALRADLGLDGARAA